MVISTEEILGIENRIGITDKIVKYKQKRYPLPALEPAIALHNESLIE